MTNLNNPIRMVSAKRAKVAEAYRQWINIKGRAKRDSNVHSDKLFVMAIRGLMDTGKATSPQKLGIPSTRQGLMNWKSGLCYPTVSLRLDVCEAIFALTRVDVTENGFLTSSEINTTDMVTLKDVTWDTTGRMHQVHVGSIDFHISAPKSVKMSDTTDRPMPSDKRTRIGSVVYSLREASIFVSSNTHLDPLMERVSDGKPTEQGHADGADVFPETNEDLRWRVQPIYPRIALQARLKELRLCVGNTLKNSDTVVFVSANRADVDPKISIERPVKNYTSKHEETRERLIEQVLRNRLPDEGLRHRVVLSHAKVKEA